MPEPNAAALAILGACGGVANIIGTGLQAADMGLKRRPGAKPDTTDYLLNECIDYTDQTQYYLNIYLENSTHSLEGLRTYQHFYGKFKHNIALLEDVLDKTSTSKSSGSGFHKIRSMLKKAITPRVLDEYHTEIIHLRDGIVKHLNQIKIHSTNALGQNDDAESHLAVNALLDLDAALAADHGRLVKLTFPKCLKDVEEKAKQYLKDENTVKKWLNAWRRKNMPTPSRHAQPSPTYPANQSQASSSQAEQGTRSRQTAGIEMASATTRRKQVKNLENPFTQ
ncbi:hypothetical protein Moror_13049 [Moniliophthora roreri MCA 2997]|uniref:Uncharacterized protein n=2 Tax=Moniliophthora roreri TaxID=221103 RepID=V2XLY3_MONRO|nr:hypothetical protein Moror_13049 [Moniliophthora roreri MCA 2997]KAI3604899.1 hypothetical protein WG66_008470 [Moniliophthora roreri]